jgi:hypothetical protein
LNWRDANEIGKAINRFRFFGSPVTVGYASGETVYKYTSAPAPVPGLAMAAPGRPRRGLLDSLEPLDATGQRISMPVTVPADTSRLIVHIWDRFGEHVRALVDDAQPGVGARDLVWDRKNDAGETVDPGMFIWRVIADGTSESRMVRLSPG